MGVWLCLSAYEGQGQPSFSRRRYRLASPWARVSQQYDGYSAWLHAEVPGGRDLGLRNLPQPRLLIRRHHLPTYLHTMQ